MGIRKKLKRANLLRKEKGWSAIGEKIKYLWHRRSEERDYQKWLKTHELTIEDRRKIKGEIVGFSRRPLISILLPVYNVEERWLRLGIESVFGQLYENWELCIADDQSPGAHVKKVLDEFAARDKRVKVVYRPENGHISAASNSALELATGEFCVLLDHDDELSEDALFYLAEEINETPETAFIYSDEDMINDEGRRFAPRFKPDFSLDLLYSLNLIVHLSAYRTDILRKIKGFRVGFEGSQDYDLALRVIEEIKENQIRHIPRVLSHWRMIPGSVAFSSDEKPYAHERARRAIREHLARTGQRATVGETLHNLHRVRYELPSVLPKVSLILVIDENFSAAQENIENLRGKTDYENLEIVLLCSEDLKKQLAENLQFENIKFVIGTHRAPAKNFNEAVRHTDSEILCFVKAGLIPLSPDWLTELASFAIQREIGAVGAKIIGDDNTVLEGGSIIGFDGLTGPAHRGISREAPGNFFRAQVANNYSAVSISCLTVRRTIFDALGGFDGENLPDALFDADFCLRLREKNLRVVLTPYAELKQTVKNSLKFKPTVKEIAYFKQRWRAVIEKDPFYNPNLSLEGKTFSIRI